MVLNIGSDYIFSVAWSEGVGFQRVAELIDRVVRATTGVRIRMPDVCSRLKAKERLCAAWSAFCFREGARPEVEEVEVRRSNRSEMIDRLTRWYRGLNYAERQQCQALFFSLNGALSEMREFGGDIQEIQLIDREECMISSHAMITLLQEVIVPTQTLKSLYVQGFTPRTPRHWRDVAVHPAPLGDPFLMGSLESLRCAGSISSSGSLSRSHRGFRDCASSAVSISAATFCERSPMSSAVW